MVPTHHRCRFLDMSGMETHMYSNYSALLNFPQISKKGILDFVAFVFRPTLLLNSFKSQTIWAKPIIRYERKQI